MTNYTFHIFTFFSPLSIIYRMSDIVTQRQRKPWFWPDTLYHLFGDGRIHDETLKVLHDFTFKVSVFKLDGKKNNNTHLLTYRKLNSTLKCVPWQVIREREEEISSMESSEDTNQEGKKRQALLDMLLKTKDEHGNKMSHKDIQEEVDTFMFEVSTSCVWICVSLFE